MKRQIIITNDGSKTIYVPNLDETYHSTHGAIQEAKHIFIKHGLAASSKKAISVFEMGFGTGLNGFLSAIYAEKHQISVDYTGIEAYPIGVDIAQEMDYDKHIEPKFIKLFQSIHHVEWGSFQKITTYFQLQKIVAKIETHSLENTAYDIVFFDAFGPRAQHEMWDLKILQKMYDCLQFGGFLVSYCAKGQVKRNLKAIGFEVETLAGPPGKREMTRAWKK